MSAGLVLISHLFLGRIDWLGALGVQIFFGISGFVICRGFMREFGSTGSISLGGFYIRRAFRILPPLVVYVAIVAIVGGDKSLFWGLSFTCNIWRHGCDGWLGAHLWTLSVEEQFYLAIPIILGVAAVRKLWRALTVMLLAVPLATLALYMIGATDTAALLSLFVTIAFGVACALNEEIVSTIAARTPKAVIPGAVLLLLATSAVTGTRLATVLHVLLIAPLVMLLLLRSIVTPSPVARFLESWPVVRLGTASYSIYLWQQAATDPSLAINVRIFLLLALVPACLLLFQRVERPLILFGRELATNRRSY